MVSYLFNLCEYIISITNIFVLLIFKSENNCFYIYQFIQVKIDLLYTGIYSIKTI